MKTILTNLKALKFRTIFSDNDVIILEIDKQKIL